MCINRVHQRVNNLTVYNPCNANETVQTKLVGKIRKTKENKKRRTAGSITGAVKFFVRFAQNDRVQCYIHLSVVCTHNHLNTKKKKKNIRSAQCSR